MTQHRRIGVLVDERYGTLDGRVFTQNPYVRFLLGLRSFGAEVVLFGRLFANGVEPRYEVDLPGVRFVPLPPYPDIAALLVRPHRFWPAIERALDAELQHLDGLWLNPGHPVSLLALAKARNLPKLRCFGVMRGDYVAEVQHHHAGLRKLAARAAMAGLLEAFAALARSRRLPCFAHGPAQVAWLQRRGVQAEPMLDSLLAREDLTRDEPLDPALRSDVLAVGRLDPIKGLDVLLRAVAPICHGNPAFLVRLVGDGPEAGRLQRLAAELGIGAQVCFDGHVRHGAALFDRLRQARVFVQASHMEGTPKSVLEALAFGVPVVASRVGGLPDLLDGPEQSGVLVEPGDEAGLREAIQRVLADEALHARLARAARGVGAGLTQEALLARLVGRVWPEDGGAAPTGSASIKSRLLQQNARTR